MEALDVVAGRIPTLTEEEEEDKKAHKPALARSVRAPTSSVFLALLLFNEPHYSLLKSRARIELLWERFLKEINQPLGE